MPRRKTPPPPPPRYAVRLRADCTGVAQAVRLRNHTTLEAAALDAACSDHFEVLDLLTGQRWSLPPQGPGGRRTGLGSPATTLGGSLTLKEEPAEPDAPGVRRPPAVTPPATTENTHVADTGPGH